MEKVPEILHPASLVEKTEEVLKGTEARLERYGATRLEIEEILGKLRKEKEGIEARIREASEFKIDANAILESLSLLIEDITQLESLLVELNEVAREDEEILASGRKLLTEYREAESVGENALEELGPEVKH